MCPHRCDKGNPIQVDNQDSTEEEEEENPWQERTWPGHNIRSWSNPWTFVSFSFKVLKEALQFCCMCYFQNLRFHKWLGACDLFSFCFGFVICPSFVGALVFSLQFEDWPWSFVRVCRVFNFCFWEGPGSEFSLILPNFAERGWAAPWTWSGCPSCWTKETLMIWILFIINC